MQKDKKKGYIIIAHGSRYRFYGSRTIGITNNNSVKLIPGEYILKIKIYPRNLQSN